MYGNELFLGTDWLGFDYEKRKKKTVGIVGTGKIGRNRG